MKNKLQSRLEEYKKVAQDLFEKLQPECAAIYLGGSLVNPYIENPKDIDYICFARDVNDVGMLIIKLKCLLKNKLYTENGNDFLQVRHLTQEEHSYGSYINKLMIKLAGQDIEFKFDIIDKDRQEYIEILKKIIELLKNNKLNAKRWYQVYMGLCILKNNSYELSEEEIENLNVLHDETEESTLIIQKILYNLENNYYGKFY